MASRSVANWKDCDTTGKWVWHACRKRTTAWRKSWSFSFYASGMDAKRTSSKLVITLTMPVAITGSSQRASIFTIFPMHVRHMQRMAGSFDRFSSFTTSTMLF